MWFVICYLGFIMVILNSRRGREQKGCFYYHGSFENTVW